LPVTKRPSTAEKSEPEQGSPSGLTAEIEKLVYGGEGLARVEGQVLLAPFVLPGERVAVRARQANTGMLRARGLPEILVSAPDRVIPRCEYFTQCGGCQYQHANYELQVSQKIGILRETLQRLGRIEYSGEIAAVTGEPWFYRNRIQLHFENGKSGFRKFGSHEIRDIDHCYISSPVLVDAIKKLDWACKQPQWPKFLRSLELFTNEHELQVTIGETNRPVAARFFEWCATFLPGFAPGAIEYEAAGFNFRISRGAFFQVNRFLIDTLISEALGDRKGSYAIDLYAGAGLFSLPLSQRYERVEAVERGGPAFRDLEHNAGRSAPNVRTVKNSAEDFLRGLQETPDLIVSDPPRAGLGKEATSEVLRLLPQELVLVSCDPATLSRDLKQLLDSYEIARLTLVDLFPQTYHFESIAHLKRK
jgi:23S rRNA (uracil1939-C5)-methyltransferase